MIIFKRKRKLSDLENDAPLGTTVEISDTDYTNSEWFPFWLKQVYSVVVKSSANQPVLLLSDVIILNLYEYSIECFEQNLSYLYYTA